MINKLILLTLCFLFVPNISFAGKTCATDAVGQISDIVYDGDSKSAPYGTVSNGTIIIDSRDLKRKQCQKGTWVTLPYDGKNANSIDPWVETQSEYRPLNQAKRQALASIGHIDCSNSYGTGFLLNLEKYGAKADRSYDVLLTSCHVVKNAQCQFYPRQKFRQRDPHAPINIATFERIYTQRPYTMSSTKSDKPCADIFNGRVSKKDARKDWVFIKLDSRVSHLPDHQRIRLEDYDSGKIKNVAKRGDLYVIGAPPQEVKYLGRSYSIFDVVYSKECRAQVKSNNLVHTCISFPGMSGGPTGYFKPDDSFVAVGINSWSSEMGIPLHQKRAEQLQRGAATAIDKEQIDALRVFIRQLEREK